MSPSLVESGEANWQVIRSRLPLSACGEGSGVRLKAVYWVCRIRALQQPGHAIHHFAFVLILELAGFDAFRGDVIFDDLVRILADDDFAAQRILLKRFGKLKRIADGGEFFAARAADVAKHGQPGMDANPVEQTMIGRQTLVKLLDVLDHR